MDKIVVDSYSQKTIQDTFKIGMSREIPELLESDSGFHVNLGSGSGFKTIKNCINIDYPECDFNKDRLPYEDNSVDVYHSYHVFEHIKNIKFLFEEIDRTLKPGGFLTAVVPYGAGSLQLSNLDHCTFFNERTFSRLFDEETYNATDYDFKLKVHTQFIIGIVERNMCLMFQLVKT